VNKCKIQNSNFEFCMISIDWVIYIVTLHNLFKHSNEDSSIVSECSKQMNYLIILTQKWWDHANNERQTELYKIQLYWILFFFSWIFLWDQTCNNDNNSEFLHLVQFFFTKLHFKVFYKLYRIQNFKIQHDYWLPYVLSQLQRNLHIHKLSP
jgi:hypothetical protein